MRRWSWALAAALLIVAGAGRAQDVQHGAGEVRLVTPANDSAMDESLNAVRITGVGGSITANLGTLNGVALDATLQSLLARFPVGGALADGTANPTTTSIGSFGFVFNGSTWDRLRGDTANGLDVDVTRLPALATGSNTIGGVNLSQYSPVSGRLPVDGSGVTQPVSGTLSISGALDTELPAAASLADGTSNPSTTSVGAFGFVFNGSTWDRARGDTTNGLDVDVTRLPALATGANTIGAVNLAQYTPASGRLPVDGSGVTQPVSGTVTANLGTLNGAALDASVTGLQVSQGSTTSAQKGPLAQGAVTTAAPSYTTAQTSPLSLTTSGALRIDSSTVAGTAVDTNSGTKSAGTQRFVIATDQPQLTNALKVDGSAVTQPVSGTVTANVGTTNGLGLDTTIAGLQVSQGSTTSGQKGGLQLGAVTTAAPSYTTAQSSPLSLTTGGLLRVDGSGATQPVSGTVTSNAGTGTFTVGQGTAANLKAQVQGEAAHDAVSSGNPILAGGYASAAAPSDVSADGDAVRAWHLRNGAQASVLTAAGALIGGDAANGLDVDVTRLPALPTGGNTIGTVNLGTLNGVALDASVTGLQVSQGSTTSGQKGGLGLGAVTTAAPSYTTAQTSPLSLTTGGLLRTDGSGTTQPVSGTVTSNQGTAAAGSGAWPFAVTDTSNTVVKPGDAANNAVRVNVIASAAGGGGTSSNYGSAFPSAGTAAGFSDGTNMQGARVFDADTGGGTQYVAGVSLRKAASGGTVEAGTSSDPLRTDPTGTTAQPVSQATASSLNAQVQGAGASGASKAGNPVQIGGVFNTTQPTVTTGQTVEVQSTARGAQIVATGVDPLSATQGTAAATTAGWPVIAGNVARSSAAWTSATSIDTTLSLAVTGYATVAITSNTTSTITAGTLNFEASDDSGTTWFAVQATRLNAPTIETSYTLVATTKQAWAIPVAGLTNFRLRVNPAITGTGTDTVALSASSASFVPSVTAGLATGSNTIGSVASVTTSVTPGTAAANLGKAEDVATASGDTGVGVLGARNDTAAALTSTDGDYGHLRITSAGELAVHVLSLQATGNAASLGKAEDGAHASGDIGVAAFGVRNDGLQSALTSADGDYSTIATDAAGSAWARQRHVTTVVVAEGTTGATATATLSAPGANLFHYITKIILEEVHSNATAQTPVANRVFTTTNLPGSLKFGLSEVAFAAANGQVIDKTIDFAFPLKSSTANTATTIVSPAATTNVIWRITVFYYIGVA